jgi:hypothetical protein
MAESRKIETPECIAKGRLVNSWQWCKLYFSTESGTFRKMCAMHHPATGSEQTSTCLYPGSIQQVLIYLKIERYLVVLSGLNWLLRASDKKAPVIVMRLYDFWFIRPVSGPHNQCGTNPAPDVHMPSYAQTPGDHRQRHPVPSLDAGPPLDRAGCVIGKQTRGHFGRPGDCRAQCHKRARHEPQNGQVPYRGPAPMSNREYSDMPNYSRFSHF